MYNIAIRLMACRRAATAIEYGLVACMISLAIISALTAFADAGVGMWNDISTKVADVG